MKNTLFTLISFFIYTFSYAQQYSFSGKILDDDGYEVPFARVTELSTGNFTSSDDLGNFSIKLPKGNYIFETKSVGFEVRLDTINLDKDVFLNINTTAKVVLLEEVFLNNNEVEVALNSVEMSTEELSVEEIKSIPAFLGEPDVLNAIKLLPGVTSVGEGATGFNVRGGNIDQNLILSDNANIYSSSHFFGFFSVFNPDAVKDLKIYKGGMPSKYGERVSSVLDVHQRSGSLDKFSVDGGIGFVSSRLTVGGPIIKSKLSFLASARRTYIDQFFRFASDPSVKNSGVSFYDLNLKLDYVINPKNHVSFTGYYGKDIFSIDKGSIKFDWGNTFGVINWENSSMKNLTIKSSLSLTDYNYSLGGVDLFIWRSRISTITQKVNFEYNKIENHLLGFGIQNNNHHFRPASIKPLGSFVNVVKPFSLNHEWSMEDGIYIQDEWEMNDKITLLAGLRYSIYNTFGNANEAIYEPGKPKEKETTTDTLIFKRNDITSTYMGLEPRFSFLFKIDSLSSIKFAYNRNLQYMQLVSNTTSGLPVDVWKSSDYHIKPLKVNQIAFGYVRGLRKNTIEATAEVYYKSFRDILDYKNNAELFLNPNLETELLAGKGRAYGLEIMLRKKKGLFTGWLSYTLSKSELLVASPNKSETINNGDWYNASFNKPHDVSFVATYKLSKRLSTSLNFVYATGRAITLPDGKYEVFGEVIPSYSSRNQGKLSDFHRLDVSAELQSKKNDSRKWKSYWVFSIYNVYARRNAYSYTFNGEPGYDAKVERLAILGTIFPSATYNFKF